MSFENLPETWSDLPLDDPGLAADVADLVVGHADRMAGCIAVLLLDEGLRLAQPALVNDVTDDLDPLEVEPFLRRLAAMVTESGGALVFVRGRPGSVLLTDADRGWHDVVLRATGSAGARLVGAFVATPAAVRAYPAPPGERVAEAS